MTQKLWQNFCNKKNATKKRRMEKKETICKLLGTTQEEMGMLLGVSRGQWSMFESGKRDLPSAALQFLSEILAHLQSPEAKTTKTQATLAKEAAKKKQTLEALIKENQYQQLLVAKKIADIEKKQEASVKALQLAAFLNKRTDKNREHDADFLKKMEARANKAIALNGLSVLVTCQIKQAVLHQEEAVLKVALKGLS